MKVSIVIPTFNSEEFIKIAIDSVLSQTYPDIECIVVDGGSKDGTLKILESYGTKINFISEKDKGVFDALNKGVKKAQGEIIGWLGADDFYANQTVIATAVRNMKETNAFLCWGDLVYVDRYNTDKILRYWKSSVYEKGLMKKGWQLPHFASFIRKEIFETYGYFRLDFKISADYEFFLRVLEKKHITSFYVPSLFLKMRTGGISNQSIGNIMKGNRDCYKAWKVNGLKINPLTLFLRKPFLKIWQYWKKPSIEV